MSEIDHLLVFLVLLNRLRDAPPNPFCLFATRHTGLPRGVGPRGFSGAGASPLVAIHRRDFGPASVRSPPGRPLDHIGCHSSRWMRPRICRERPACQATFGEFQRRHTEHLAVVQLRHHEVEEHEIERPRPEQRERLAAVVGGDDVGVAQALEAAGQGVAVVLDDEQRAASRARRGGSSPP